MEISEGENYEAIDVGASDDAKIKLSGVQLLFWPALIDGN